jgi:hypothetical protein
MGDDRKTESFRHAPAGETQDGEAGAWRPLALSLVGGVPHDHSAAIEGRPTISHCYRCRLDATVAAIPAGESAEPAGGDRSKTCIEEAGVDDAVDREPTSGVQPEPVAGQASDGASPSMREDPAVEHFKRVAEIRAEFRSVVLWLDEHGALLLPGAASMDFDNEAKAAEFEEQYVASRLSSTPRGGGPDAG